METIKITTTEVHEDGTETKTDGVAYVIESKEDLEALFNAAEKKSRARKPRKDAHRPSAINPDDYEYVAAGCIKIESLGDAMFIQSERQRIQAHMKRTGGTYSRHEHGGNCHCCGSVNAIYTALFYHAATNSYVRFGQDCATKLDMGNAEAFRKVRTEAQALRKSRAGKLKAQAILNEAGLSEAWAIFTAGMPEMPEDEAPWKYAQRTKEESIINDMVHKLIKYGDISPNALKLLRVNVDRIANRANIEAKRAAEKAAAADAPNGRQEVTGLVLKVEDRENDFGTRKVMSLKHETGFVVWGTVPAGLDVQRGDTVTFTATFERKSDRTFATFKRPACATLTKSAERVAKEESEARGAIAEEEARSIAAADHDLTEELMLLACAMGDATHDDVTVGDAYTADRLSNAMATGRFNFARYKAVMA